MTRTRSFLRLNAGLRRRLRAARGAGAVEYALALALLVVPMVVVADDLAEGEQEAITERGASIGNPTGANLIPVVPGAGVTTTTTTTTTSTTTPPTTSTTTTTTTAPPTTTTTPPTTTTVPGATTTVPPTTTTIPLVQRMDVSDLETGRTTQPGSKWTATFTVTVSNGLGQPLGGVTVSASWTSYANSSGPVTTCTTTSAGTCSMSQQSLKCAGANPQTSTTFTVDSIVLSGLTWDVDLYSEATTGTITKPSSCA